MNNDYDKVMASKSDLQLTAILTTERDQFQQEALLAAEMELKKRNLDLSTIANLKSQIESAAQEDATNAEAPLEAFWKVLAFLIPGLIPMMLSGSFKAGGFHQKARELMRWTVYGFIFYFGIILIVKMILS